ncbi:MAG: hypothetical protein M1319_01490 [Chloroflexi bacterium]|nr:hypothetical protein [Chloroflexota bacterium]
MLGNSDRDEDVYPFGDVFATWTGKDVGWEANVSPSTSYSVLYVCESCGKELIESRPGSGILSCCGKRMLRRGSIHDHH